MKKLTGILIIIIALCLVGCSSVSMDPIDMCKNAYISLADDDHVHFTLDQSVEASDGSYASFESHERWYSGNNWLDITDKDSFEFSLLQFDGIQYSNYSNASEGWQTVENTTSLTPTWKAASWESLGAEVISDTDTSEGREIICSVKNEEMKDAQYIFNFDDTDNLISLTVSGSTPMSDTVTIRAEFKHIIHGTDDVEIQQRIMTAKDEIK